jgi:hypothetical protein
MKQQQYTPYFPHRFVDMSHKPSHYQRASGDFSRQGIIEGPRDVLGRRESGNQGNRSAAADAGFFFENPLNSG